MTRDPLRFVPSLVATVLLACVAPRAHAIVVRHDVPDASYRGVEADFPAVFSLYRTKRGFRDCLATLVAPRYALTAAHCTEEPRLLDQLGPGKPGYAVDIAGQPRRVVAVIRYPGTSGGAAPDLAIVRLDAPVAGIEPVPLQDCGDEVGHVVRMPGWGTTGTGRTGANVQDGLFRVAENRVDRAAKGRLYWRFDDPTHANALALEGISGPGDSGGPALLLRDGTWRIAGVSSAQRTMGGPEGIYGVEEVFVRVYDFRTWIGTVIAAVPQQP